MVIRLLALLALLASAGASLAQGSGGEVEVSVTVDGPAPEVFVQEAVVVTIRAVLHRPVFSFEALTPPIPNTRSVALGKDRWTANVDGLGARAVERRMAVFAQRSGPLEIPAFELRATLVDPSNRLYPVEVRTEPRILEVSPGPGAAALPWWLPARAVRVTDSWARPPDELLQGEAVRRTVVIEADGVLAEQLPPLPPLRTAGIITFANPVKLETVIRPDGPSARATYQWDVRLGAPEPIVLQALTIPWFDTGARRMRDATIPARRIGSPALVAAPAAPAPAAPQGFWTASTLLAAAAAFAAGFAWLVGPRRGMPEAGAWARRLRRDRRLLRDLRRAARRRDPSRFRSAVSDLFRHEARNGRPPAWAGDPDLRGALAAIDRHLFGGVPGPDPDLRAALRVLRAARRRPSEGQNAALLGDAWGS
jgi:hypothetical protein